MIPFTFAEYIDFIVPHLDRTMYMRQLIEELRELEREFGVRSLSDVRDQLEQLRLARMRIAELKVELELEKRSRDE